MKTYLAFLLALLGAIHPAFAQEMTLSTLTLTPADNPNVFGAVLSPVYTDGALLAPSQTSSYWGTFGNSGFPFQGPAQSSCLSGCQGVAGMAGFTFLEAAFATPVDSVSITEYANSFNTAGFQAFDSAGNIIGTCNQFMSCYTALSAQPVNGEPGGVFTFSDPGAISTILATSYDPAPAQISDVSYQSVPLPGAFWMLVAGLVALGRWARK